MGRSMKRLWMILATAVFLVPAAAQAQSMKKIQQQLNEIQQKLGEVNIVLECQGAPGDEKIQKCTRLIKRGVKDKGTLALLHDERGMAYLAKDEVTLGMADLDEAVRLNGREPGPYIFRGRGKVFLGQYEEAVKDYTHANERNSKKGAWVLVLRGEAYVYNGDMERARADFSEALRLEPTGFQAARAHAGLGDVFRKKQQLDSAIGEYEEAIGHAPETDAEAIARTYLGRGAAYLDRGDYDRALADYTRVISSGAGVCGGHLGRGEAYEALGQRENALIEYRKVIERASNFALDRKRLVEARKRIAALEAQPAVAAVAPPAPSKAVAATPAERPAQPPSRKIALVIGMSAYANVPALPNPRNDARAIAQSFRRLGFADVTERYDLDLAGFSTALKDFSDKAANSDWAVIFYAGHGIEAGGVNYLIPVDARLAS